MEEYLTILRTASVLGIARATVARMIADGRLYSMKQPFYRRGGKKRIPRAEVEALIATLPEPDRTAALTRLRGP